MNRLVEIDTRFVEGDFIIALNGDLDASSSVLLDDIIQDGLRRNPLSVCVDCAGLKYISSAGLGVFISNLQEFRRLSVPLVLFSLREPVRNVFHLLGLDQLIPVFSSRDGALSWCRSGKPEAA
jgi:anti-sigma B factor antagonist